MSVTFLEPGTDVTQDLAFWPNSDVSGGGTAASATDQAVTGARSLKLVVGSAGQSVYLGSADGVCADAGTRISARVRFSAIPTDVMSFLGVWQTGFGSTLLGLLLTAAGKLQLTDGNIVLGSAGATTIAATTWTRITLSYVVTSAANWTAKVYVNGVLEFTRSNADATLTNGTGGSEIGPNLSLGPTGAGSALTAWYDDFYVDNLTDLGDPGDIHVAVKRPIANGTTNGFTTQIGAGGSGVGTGHAPQVNERPLSQTNGWAMVGVGAAVTEEYNVEGLSVGDVDLTGATIVDWLGWIFAKSLASETASLVVGGASSNVSLTSTPTLFTQAKGSTTYPAGSGTDVGLVTATTATTVSLYEAGVLVAYRLATALSVPVGALSLAGKIVSLGLATVLSASSLVFAGKAPTLAVGGGTTISPAAGVLAYAGQTPTLQSNFTIAAPVGALLLAGRTPSLGGSATIAPPAGALTFAGQTPAALIPVAVAVPVGSVVYAGKTPTLSSPGTIAVPAGSLVCSSQATSLGVGVGIPAGLLRLDGQYPFFAFLDPAPGVLTFAGQTPSLAISGQITRAIPAGAITLAGQTPSLRFDLVLGVPVGALTLVGKTPSIGGLTTIAVPAGSLLMAGQISTLQSNLTIAVPVGALVVTGLVPSSALSGGISPAAGALILAGKTPTIRFDFTIATPSGVLTFESLPPTILGAGAISPAAGELSLVGQVPTLGYTFVAALPAGVLALAGQTPGVHLDLTIEILSGALAFVGRTPGGPQAAYVTAFAIAAASPLFHVVI